MGFSPKAMEQKTITPQAVVDVLRHINATGIENTNWGILPEGTNIRDYWGDAAYNAPDYELPTAALWVWLTYDEVATFVNTAMPICSFMDSDKEDYILVWPM